MPGDELRITCGTQGKPCKTIDEYPICDPAAKEHGWVDRELIMVCPAEEGAPSLALIPEGEALPKECKGARAPFFHDNPKTEVVEKNEVTRFVRGDYLKNEGMKGVCRSGYLGGAEPYKWYAYKDQGGMPYYLALYNEKSPGLFKDRAGFEMHPSEVIALARCKALALRESDISFEQGQGPRITGKDSRNHPQYSSGTYNWTQVPLRLKNPKGTGIIDILKNKDVKITGLSAGRRKALIGWLELIHTNATKEERFLERTADVQEETIQIQRSNLVMMGLFIFLVGQPYFKQLYKRIRGSFQTMRYDRYIDKKLKENPGYAIRGRDVEIKASVRMMSKRSGYLNLMIDAPTGEGKDVIVEGIILQKQRGGEFPSRFRDAPVYKINAAEFQSDTMYRGTVADKVAEIARRARKGPVIYYISEIDLVFLSGGTIEGDSESPGKLVLDLTDDPEIKRNLVIVGTTSRGGKMLAKYPDLQRRFNWPEVAKFSLEQSVDVLDGPYVKELSRLYDGIEISRDVLEYSARLGEALYRPHMSRRTGQVTPRFAAITAVLETATQLALDGGERAVTFEHVVRATGELLSMTIDPSQTSFREIFMKPLRDLEASVAEDLKEAEAKTSASPHEVAGMRRMIEDAMRPEGRVERAQKYELGGVVEEFERQGFGKEEVKYVLANETLFLEECDKSWNRMDAGGRAVFGRGFAEFLAESFAGRVRRASAEGRLPHGVDREERRGGRRYATDSELPRPKPPPPPARK